MSYEVERLKAEIFSRYWVIIRPRMLVYRGAIVGSANYNLTVDNVQSVRVNGVVLTSGTDWSFNAGTKVLSISNHGTTLPENFVVVTTDMFLSDQGGYFHSIPSDGNSPQVRYVDNVVQMPSRRDSFSDAMMGILPSQSTSIKIGNTDSRMQEMLLNASFNKAEVLVYHTVGVERAANTRLFLRGHIQTISATESEIDFSILDSNSIFDQNMPLSIVIDGGSNDGAPVPSVVGRVDGVRPIISNYLWFSGVSARHKTRAAFSSPWIRAMGLRYTTHPNLNTTTRTYRNVNPGGSSTQDVINFNPIGDWVVLSSTFSTQPVTNRAYPDGWVKYTRITGYGQVGGFWYIDHEPVDNALITGAYVWSVPCVKKLYATVDGTRYELVPWRDYRDEAGVVELLAGAAGNVGAPRAFSASDQFHGTVQDGFGEVFDDQGGYFGYDTSRSMSGAKNAVRNIAAIMTKVMGVSPSNIDWVSFEAARVAVQDRTMSCSFPDTSNESAPSIRDVLGRILMSCLLRLRINRTGKWELQFVGPVGPSANHQIGERQYIEISQYEVGFKDLYSEVIVEYARREVNEVMNGPDGEAKKVARTNPIAMYFHEAQNSRVFNSVFITAADADWLAERLGWIYGERKLSVHMSLPLNALDPLPGESASVEAPFVPGAVVVEGTMQSMTGTITELEQTDETIEMTVEDQKGIEDNSGDW